jgi:hypothetical protein
VAWTEQPNGKQANDAIALDDNAIFRGGSGWADPLNIKLGLRPWSDGFPIVDEPTLRMILPSGCSYAPSVEVVTLKGQDIGFRQDIGNGFYADSLDLQAAKIPDQYTDLTAPGMKIVLWMPAAHVAALPVDGDGFITLKRLEIGGTGHTNIAIQKPEDLIDPATDTRPDWLDYGAVGYGSPEKVHVVTDPDGVVIHPWQNGKQFDIAAPLAVAWSGTISKPSIMGVVTGRLALVGGELHKLFLRSELQPYLDSGAVLFSTDATWGYTAVPGTGNNNMWGNAHEETIPEAGDISSMSLIASGGSATTAFNVTTSMYDFSTWGTSLSANTNSRAWGVAGGTDPSSVGFTRSKETYSTAYTYTITYTGTKPVLTASSKMQIIFQALVSPDVGQYRYDSGLGANYRMLRYGTAAGNAPPDPNGSPASNLSGYSTGLFVTYAAGGGGSRVERGMSRGVRRGVERGV